MNLYSGRLEIRETPWDERALGYKSNEIIKYPVDLNFYEVSEFDNYCEQKGYKFTSIRIPYSDYEKYRMFSSVGYNLVEIVYLLQCDKLSFRKGDVNFMKIINVIDASDCDPNLIVKCFSNMFRFGRFYEDPHIPLSTAERRTSLWIHDLILYAHFKVLMRNNSIPIGFMAYDLSGSRANLILGGVVSGFSHLAYSFWASICNSLFESDVNLITTTVSASNLGVISLYLKLGFSPINAFRGLHKHR